MKAVIPYAILGAIGAGGAFFGTDAITIAKGEHGATQKGPVRIEASLERTHLPTSGGDVFARIALQGVESPNDAQKRVPVSLTLVIDRSGSMAGGKMEDAKRAAREAIAGLANDDRACVVSFDNGAEHHGCGTRDTLFSAIDSLFARGSTDMTAGLDVGGRAAGEIFGADRVNRLLLLSDGRPNTESNLREQVSALAKRGITTTTLGLGADYNEDLMSALADAGLGRYYFIDKPEQLAGIFLAELSSLATIVARGSVIELAPLHGAQIVDVIGFQHERSGERVIISGGDIYAGRTTDILVRLRAPSAEGEKALVDAKIAYTNATTNARSETTKSLSAVFTKDAKAIEQGLVAAVVVKAEKWRAAQAWVEANEAYNRNDFAAGDRILSQAQARLDDQAKSQKDKDLAMELAKEKAEMKSYQIQNAEGGLGTRGSMNKAAKKKAWSMNKGSAY